MRIRVVLPAAAWTAAAVIVPVAARADDAAPGTGGAPPGLAAGVDAIACRSSCDATGAVAPGGLVRLRGRGLASAARVIFGGGRSAPAVRAQASRVDARVPAGAAPGAVRVATASGVVSAPSAVALRVAAAPGVAPAPLAAPRPARRLALPAAKRGVHVDARLVARRVVFGAPQSATLRYAVRDPAPLDVAIDLVRVPDGAPVAHWPAATVAPGAEQVVTWNGLAGARVPRAGAYEFRIFTAPAGVTAASAQSDGPDATAPFAFAGEVFPVAGAYQFAAGSGRFGAPRGGYAHQGQDVPSPCGTPLVAVRAGTVKFRAFQARAGNYVVIDGDKTGWDYVYMHLRDPSPFDKGAHVATGQPIGTVGETGDAEGCHLHFELWSSPGWYTGGHAIAPLPSLLRWAGQG